MAQPDNGQPTSVGGQGFYNNGFAWDGIELTPVDSPAVKVDERVGEQTFKQVDKNAGDKYVVGEIPAVDDESGEPVEYKSYSERWWLVASVSLLNVANYAHWISFASVNSKAAVFYQVPFELIDPIQLNFSSLKSMKLKQQPQQSEIDL